jgi:hypothetical protein
MATAYRSSLTVHVLRVSGSSIDNILALSYGLTAPNTRVTSAALTSKVKGHSRLMMKLLTGSGKTANLRGKVRGGSLMEIGTQVTGSKADCRVMASITRRMRHIRETILQIVKMAREKRFFIN